MVAEVPKWEVEVEAWSQGLAVQQLLVFQMSKSTELTL